MKKIIFVLSIIIASVSMAIGLYFGIYNYNKAREAEEVVDEPYYYNLACEKLNNYEPEHAHSLFEKIISYKDSKTKNGIAKSMIELKKSNPDLEEAIKYTAEVDGACEVNFISKGSSIDPITYQGKKEGKYLTPTSTLERYSFKSWVFSEYSYDKNTNNIHLEVIADFDYATYNISYELGEGYILDAPTKFKYNTGDTLIPNPYREGYTFVGWSINLKEEILEPNKKYEYDTAIFKTDDENHLVILNGSYGNILLTANWRVNQYHITFIPGENATCSIAQGDYIYDSEYEEPIASKDYYNFAGWYTLEGGKGTKVDFSKFNIGKDCEIYAYFIPIQYNIDYQLPADAFFTKEYASTYNYETDGYNSPYPVRINYLFSGWMYEGSHEPFVDFNINAGTHGDIKLIPLWTEIEYDSSGTALKNVKLFDNSTYDVTPYLVITENIKKIIPGAFKDFKSVKEFRVDPDNENFKVQDGFIVSKDGVELYAYPYFDDSVTSIEIPDSVKIIKSYAFGEIGENKPYQNLVSVISNNAEEIGDYVFSGMKFVRLNFSNVKVIGNYSFANCTNLISFNNTAGIDGTAFFENVTNIGEYAFYNTKFEFVSLGENVVSIGEGAFAQENSTPTIEEFSSLAVSLDSYANILYGQTALKKLTLHCSITPIEEMFFKNFEPYKVNEYDVYPTLNSIKISGVTKICDNFFRRFSYTNLFNNSIKVDLLDSDIIEIGKYAFHNFLTMNNGYNYDFGLSFYENLISIEDYGFSECSFGTPNDSNMQLSLSSIEYLGIGAFENAIIHTLVINDDCKTISEDVFKNAKIQNIKINADLFTEYSTLIGGKYAYYETYFNTSFMGYDVKSTSIRITKGEISKGAFKGISGITYVELAKDVTLAEEAFSGCSDLEKVYFKEGYIGEIPTRCFENCSKLVGVHYTNLRADFELYCKNDQDELVYAITKIGDHAFSNCIMLVNHLYEDQDHNKKTASEYLTYIGKRAFENCFGFNGVFEFKNDIEIYDYAFANTIISVKYIENKVTLKDEGYGFMDINGSVEKINS